MSGTRHPRVRLVAGTQAEASEPLWPELERDIAERRQRGRALFSTLQYAAIARIIRRRFPGLEVCYLWSLDDATAFGFRWFAERSVTEGLVPKGLIPPPPKRVFSAFGGAPLEAYGRRVGGGRVEVNIRVPDDVSADHQLSFLRPSAIRALAPMHDARSIEQWLEHARRRLQCSFHGILDVFLIYLEEKPDASAWFGWRAGELDDIREFVEETKRRFEPLLGSLRAEDRRRSMLRA